jgi:hypothetical protein
MEYTIHTLWDADASVWVAQSDDIPGLVLESGSLDVLMERLRYAVPELLKLDSVDPQGVTLLIKSERHEAVCA